MKKLKPKTQEEARQYAIDWQRWQSEQNLSYGELAEWHNIFTNLADEFDLVDEFNENGIISTKPLIHRRESKTYKEMTPYLAVGYAEGFEEAENNEQVLCAWQYLVDTGRVWQLQGWFGRTAQTLIDNGIIDVSPENKKPTA